MPVYEDVIAFQIQAITATTETPEFRALGVGGLFVVFRVQTQGTGTCALRLQGKEILANTFYTVNVDATGAAAGNNVWIFTPAGQRQPDGEAAATAATIVRQFVSLPPPDTFRFQLAKSDASSWEVGITFRRVGS